MSTAYEYRVAITRRTGASFTHGPMSLVEARDVRDFHASLDTTVVVNIQRRPKPEEWIELMDERRRGPGW